MKLQVDLEELDEKWNELQWTKPPEERQFLEEYLSLREEQYGTIRPYETKWYEDFYGLAKKGYEWLESKMPTVEGIIPKIEGFGGKINELYNWLYPQGIQGLPKQWGSALTKTGETIGESATWLARFCPEQEDLVSWEEQEPARQALTLAQATSLIALASLIGYTAVSDIAGLSKYLLYGKADKIAEKFGRQEFIRIKANNPLHIKTPEDAVAATQATLRGIVGPTIETEYPISVATKLGKLGQILLKPVSGPTEQVKANLLAQVRTGLSQSGIKITTDILQPFIQTIEHHLGTPASGIITKEYAKATVAVINKFLPTMIEQTQTIGQATIPFERLTPEEKIVEREIVKPLAKVPPGEKIQVYTGSREKWEKELRDLRDEMVAIEARRDLTTRQKSETLRFQEERITDVETMLRRVDEGLAKFEIEVKAPPGEEITPKVELYSGMPITKEFVDKAFPPSSPYTLNIEKAMNEQYAKSNLGVVYGKQIATGILKDMKTKGIDESRFKMIYKYREMPEKYAGEINASEREIADELGKIFDEFHNTAKEHGVLEAYRENYLPHIYKNKPEEVWKKLYPTGGRRLGAKFRFAKERKIATTDEAEELGLDPIYDVPTLIQIYATALHRTIANKEFIDTAKNMTDEAGIPLIMRGDLAPPNYKWISEPAFKRYMWIGEREIKEGEKQTLLTKIEAKAHPDLAKVINDMTATYQSYPSWLKTLRVGQGVVKRLIMYNPLIHGTNIFSDTLDEMNFNIFKTVNATFRGKIPDELMKELDFKDFDAVDVDMVEHGVASDAVWGASREMYERIQKLEGTDTAKILQPLIKLRDLNDKILWGSIVLNSQRVVYLNYVHQELEKNPEVDLNQLKKEAAHFTNDLLGTLPSTVFTKNQALMTNLFLFARNWTVSNLRLLTGAMGEYGTSKNLPGLLRHKGLTTEEANRMAPHYQNHLIKGFMALILGTIFVNSAIKSARKRKAQLWLPTEAEKGHWFDIDTGLRDKKGRKIYIKPHLFRYIGDYIGWGTKPIETLRNKMEPLMKTAAEQIMNYSWWQKRPISDREGIAQLKDRITYQFRGTTPYGTVYGVTQPATEWWEPIVTATGTWTRHGVSPEIYTRFNSLALEDRRAFEDELGDDASDFRRLLRKQYKLRPLSDDELDGCSKYALKIIEFRQRLRTKWRDVDNEIDRLILKGKESEAKRLMRKSGRYKTVKGILDRIRRVKGGVMD